MPKRGEVDTKTTGSFVKRTRALYESHAWRALPYAARAVLDRLELEHMRNGGAKNGRLIVTLAQFREDGFGRDTVLKAIRQCEALGFLEVVRGGFAKVDVVRRRPNRYRLTHVSGSDKAMPSNEWQRFESREEALSALKVAVCAETETTNVVPFKRAA